MIKKEENASMQLLLGDIARGKVKNSDLKVVGVVLAILAFFVFVPGALSSFKFLSTEYVYLMSFLKFAILATSGECLALRIRTGCYNSADFGILPKMIVWGGLGIFIKLAFVIFATGVPSVLATLGLGMDSNTLQSGNLGLRVVTAFAISICMNLIFAPIMMTIHKITDLHIQDYKGKLVALLNPIDVAGILNKIDWQVMFHIVFKLTIPFFWIPAHTITFLLPSEYQVLFAAVLGIALGLILATATAEKPRAKDNMMVLE